MASRSSASAGAGAGASQPCEKGLKRRTSKDLSVRDTSEQVTIRPLGAGQEVGRSCFIMRYQNKGVMFDCGIHPAYAGTRSLPMLDDESLGSVGVALITHFHLDHCAAVPFLVASTDFKGRILMTHATKNIFYTMLKDMLRMHKKDPARQLFTADVLEHTMSLISVINFHQTMDIDGIQVTPYRAGHVLGAAMFMVEIQGMRCLYTGDYSRLPDRHMPAADVPRNPPHILIVESTFGVSNHLPRNDRERNFQSKVREIVGQGGRCLIPVVALGRAQELLLILEDAWSRHPELRSVPIYQTSGIAAQSLSVYQTYIEMMNEDVRAAFKQRNPFDFRHVRHTRGFRADSEMGACVVLATPSMLQTGLSRELFEAWCEDPKNGVIIADFAVQGTLAAELLTHPRETLASDGRTLKIRCSIASFSFSAHADYSQTSEFVETLAPRHVVLCHGNINEMERLKKALTKQATTQKATRDVHMPRNLDTIELPFKPRRALHVVGAAAAKAPKVGERVHGVFVQRQAQANGMLMAPEDLGQYNKVAAGRVVQRQALKLRKPFTDSRLALELLFEGVEAGMKMGAVEFQGATVSGAESLLVAEDVTMTHVPPDPDDPEDEHGAVLLSWVSGPRADCTADAVVAVLLQEQGKPAAVGAAEAARQQALAEGNTKDLRSAEKSMAVELMKAQFGSAAVDADGVITFSTSCTQVSVDWEADRVECTPPDPSLLARVQTCLDRMRAALSRVHPDDLSCQDSSTCA